MWRLVYGLVAAIVLAAIVARASGAAIYRSRTLTFQYPAAWHVKARAHADGTTIFARLGNDRSDRSCRFVRLRPTACSRLPLGGVFMEWMLTDAWRSMPWFNILRPGPCRTMGGDETVVRAFAVPWYFVQACIRGPGIKRTERQVVAVLRSAQFTTG